MKLIILDRDGVINFDSEYYIKSPAECEPIPGSLEAIGKLCTHGYTIAVASNQSGIGRGLYDESTLEAIHQKLQHALTRFHGRIDKFVHCPHLPEDDCLCRKPKPGLLLNIAAYYQLSLAATMFVGDSYRDIEAATLAGCKPVLVLTGNGYATLEEHPELQHNIAIYDDLATFARALTNPNVDHSLAF